MSDRAILTRVLALSLTLAVAACGRDASQAEAMPGQEAPPQQVPEQEMSMETMAVDMKEVGGSGVMGEVSIMHHGDDVMVTLNLQGLPEAGEYASHIHEGTCESGGGVAVRLNAVTAGEDGAGTSTTTFSSEELDPDGSYFVQTHGAGGAPIACADVPRHPM